MMNSEKLKYLLLEYGASDHVWMDSQHVMNAVIYQECVVAYEATADTFWVNDYCTYRRYVAVNLVEGGYAGPGN
jgi:hypothetical protein